MAAVGCTVCLHRKICTLRDAGGFQLAYGGPARMGLPRPMPCGGPPMYERDPTLPTPAEWRRGRAEEAAPRRPRREDGLTRPGWGPEDAPGA